ncbi:hypothetical protein HHL28_16685 [Aerophototrophica crusticola]|uniref:Peptidase S9 prolyl oligopeptidase catalytic domain-containing protein n=1 Tax=Aerophototrophica crusticola TaxID=1709002 RepID=A0A858RBD8_9PROT|nr:hypothetical protein HHL28_16685 [Rhodospirillaceae bacterium B3]
MRLGKFAAGLFVMGLVAAGTLASGAAGAQPAPPPVSAYAAPLGGEVRQLSLSPDGTHVAFVTMLNGKMVTVINKLQPAPGDKAQIFPPPDGATTRWVEWMNNERLLVGVGTVEMVNGPTRRLPQRYQTILAVNKDGSKPMKLRARAILQYVDDRTVLAVRADDDPFAAPEIVRMDVYTNDYKVMQAAKQGQISFLPDPTGKIRVASDYNDGKREGRVLIREKPEDSFQTLRTFKDTDPVFEMLGFSPDDPDMVYVASGHEGDKAAVYTFSLKTRDFVQKVASDPRFDVAGAIVRRGRVLGITWTDDMDTIRWLDPEKQKLQEALDKAIPDSRELIVDWTNDGRFTLVRSISPNEPNVYRLFDRDTKQFTFFADTYPNIPPEALGTRKLVTYKARDGKDIDAYLTLPPGREPKNLPLILLPHGGPIARDDLGFEVHSQFLASRGYAVLQPNFRASAGYGHAFVLAGKGSGAARCRTT